MAAVLCSSRPVCGVDPPHGLPLYPPSSITFYPSIPLPLVVCLLLACLLSPESIHHCPCLVAHGAALIVCLDPARAHLNAVVLSLALASSFAFFLLSLAAFHTPAASPAACPLRLFQHQTPSPSFHYSLSRPVAPAWVPVSRGVPLTAFQYAHRQLNSANQNKHRT